MTRDRTPRELRERMEHVAVRRRQPPQAASKRRTDPRPDTKDLDVTVVPVRRAGTTSARQSGDRGERQPGGVQAMPPARSAGRHPEHRLPDRRVAEHRSRVEMLVAWGMWEFVTVPARRLRWLRAVISPDDSRTDDPRRGD